VPVCMRIRCACEHEAQRSVLYGLGVLVGIRLRCACFRQAGFQAFRLFDPPGQLDDAQLHIAQASLLLPTVLLEEQRTAVSCTYPKQLKEQILVPLIHEHKTALSSMCKTA